MSKARGLADLGNVYDDGALSNRNLIVNSAMQVAQRGTSFTGITTSNTKTLDRFQAENGTSATYTVEQVADAPSGFTWSLKSTVTTADTSLSSSDFMQIKYSVEGYDFTASGFGTSDAKHLTISFYVKCSKAGTFSTLFTNSAQDRHCAVQFSIDAADTWQRVYATIPPCTDGTWLNTNGAGLEIRIGYSKYGSTYEAANTSDVVGKWRSAPFTDAFPVNSINLAETVNATFQITGVQLEVGDTATPFEHRSYGDELARCQRYFERWTFHSLFDWYVTSTAGHAHDVDCPYNGSFAVAKRAIPTYSRSGTFVVDNLYSNDWVPKHTENTVNFYNSSSAAGRYYSYNSSTSAYFDFDAEL